MGNPLGVYSSFFKEPTKEKWRSAAEAGILDAELSFPAEPSVELFLERAETHYQLLIEGGLRVSSIHLPFSSQVDISLIDEGSAVVEDMKKILDWAGEKNIGIAVIHGSSEPIDIEDRPARLAMSVRSIKILGAYAKTKNITLAVEDLPRTCLGNCAEEMLILTDKGQNASICFDVNHLLLESHEDFFEKIAPYVVTTHFSDYDRIDERHWLAGDGCINWKELIDMFEKSNYRGPYLFELNELSSPKMGRPFSPAELVERFRKITGK